MSPHRIATAGHASRRAFGSAFHDYVRGVFADHSERSRLLRTRRARWLQRLAQRPATGSERRWEGEGGSTR